MGKNGIDWLREEIARLEGEIKKDPCGCEGDLRRELEEHKMALERQERELAKERWT